MRKNTNKKIKRNKIKRTIDIFTNKAKIMKKISLKINKNFSESSIKTKNNNDYKDNYNQYMNQSFNINCIDFINNYLFNYFDNLNVKNIKIKFIDLIKELMMDEMEIALFSLIIDNYGLNSFQDNIDDYLLCLGLFTKKLTNNNLDIIFNKINENKNDFYLYYLNWEKSIIPFIPNIILINERYNKLIKFNVNKCKNNILNYDLIVDEIIKMSIFNKDNKIKKEKNNIKEINLIDAIVTKKIEKDKNINNVNNNLNLDIQNFFFNPITSGLFFDENLNSLINSYNTELLDTNSNIYQENKQNYLSLLNNPNIIKNMNSNINECEIAQNLMSITPSFNK